MKKYITIVAAIEYIIAVKIATREEITVDSLLITIKPTKTLKRRLNKISVIGVTLFIKLLSNMLFTKVVWISTPGKILSVGTLFKSNREVALVPIYIILSLK